MNLRFQFLIYDNILQEKLYLSFIKKAKNVLYDGIGLSFIQDGNIPIRIKSMLKQVSAYHDKLIWPRNQNPKK